LVRFRSGYWLLGRLVLVAPLLVVRLVLALFVERALAVVVAVVPLRQSEFPALSVPWSESELGK
jgi:hypothetical protein